MARKTEADFDPDLLVLFNAYVHGAIDRRGFLDKARKCTVGGLTAAMLLDQLSPNFVEAQQVSPEDKRLKTERVSYPSPSGNEKTNGYWCARQMRPGNCRLCSSSTRIAASTRTSRTLHAGSPSKSFLTFAPDALAAVGGVSGQRGQSAGAVRDARSREDGGGHAASANYLKTRPESTVKIGVVGFCWGRRWRTHSRPGCPTSPPRSRSTAEPRRRRRRRRSRPPSSFTLRTTISGSPIHLRRASRR